MVNKESIQINKLYLTSELHHTISQWLMYRNMDPALLDNLPKEGCIALYGGKPVAIGFLRQIEGGTAMIDGFLGDPHCDPELRSECLDQMGIELLKRAKELEITALFVITEIKNTLKRAQKFGFNRTSHVLLSLDLSK